jgi:hypothetical protein
MDVLIFASVTFAVGLFLGSRWQYRRLLRQIYDVAMHDGPRAARWSRIASD